MNRELNQQIATLAGSGTSILIALLMNDLLVLAAIQLFALGVLAGMMLMAHAIRRQKNETQN